MLDIDLDFTALLGSEPATVSWDLWCVTFSFGNGNGGKSDLRVIAVNFL